MTPATEPDDAFEGWLLNLDHVLDIEAGLREILLHARHDAAVDSLDSVLDVDGGLASIVGTAVPHPEPGEPLPVRASSVSVEQGTGAWSGWPVKPANRMLLRNRASIRHSRRIIELCLSFVSEPGRPAAHAIMRTLARVLLADVSKPALEGSIAGTRCADELASVGMLAGFISRELISPRVDHLLPWITEIEARLVNIDVTGVDQGTVETWGLERMRTRAYALEAAAAAFQGLPLTGGLSGHPATETARTKYLEVIDLCAADMQRTIRVATGHRVVLPDAASVELFLDDFTEADLSRMTRLRSSDLVGVLWSEAGTRWPVGIDADELRRRSEVVRDGVWVISPGTSASAEHLIG